MAGTFKKRWENVVKSWDFTHGKIGESPTSVEIEQQTTQELGHCPFSVGQNPAPSPLIWGDLIQVSFPQADRQPFRSMMQTKPPLDVRIS